MTGKAGQSTRPVPKAPGESLEEKIADLIADAPVPSRSQGLPSPGSVSETRIAVAATGLLPNADEQSADREVLTPEQPVPGTSPGTLEAGDSDQNKTFAPPDIGAAAEKIELSPLPGPEKDTPEVNLPEISPRKIPRHQTGLPPADRDSPEGGFDLKLLTAKATKLEDSKSDNSARKSSLAGSDVAASDGETEIDVTWDEELAATRRPMANFTETVPAPSNALSMVKKEKDRILGKGILPAAVVKAAPPVAQLPAAISPTYTPLSRQLPSRGQHVKESTAYDELMPAESVKTIAQILEKRVAETISPEENPSVQFEIEEDVENELVGLTGEELRLAAEDLLNSNPKKLLRLSPHLFGQPYAFEYIKLAVALHPGYALECTPYYHPEMRREILRRALSVAAQNETGPFFENAHLWLPFSDDDFSEKLFSLAVSKNDGNWWSAAQFLFNAPKYKDKAFVMRIAAKNQHMIVRLQDWDTDLFLHYLNRFFDLIDASQAQQLMIVSADRRPIKVLERFPIFANAPWSKKILGAIIEINAPGAFDFAVTRADDAMAKMIMEAISQKNSKMLIQRFKEYEKRPIALEVLDFAFDRLKEEDPAAAFELAVLLPDKEKVSVELIKIAEKQPKVALTSCKLYSSEPYAGAVRTAAIITNPGMALELAALYETAYRQEVITNAASLAAELDTETFFLTADRWLPMVDDEFGEKVLRQARKNNSMAALKHARKYASKPFGLSVLAEATKQVLEENPVGILQNFTLFGDLLKPEEAERLVSAAAKMQSFPVLENFKNYANMPFANDILKMLVRKDQFATIIFAVKADDELGQKIMEIAAIEYPNEILRSYEQFKNKSWAKQIIRLAADISVDNEPRTLIECFHLIKDEADAEMFLDRAIKSDPIPALLLSEHYIGESYGLNMKELAAEEAKVRYPEDTMRVAYAFAGDTFAEGIIGDIAEKHPDMALKYAYQYAVQPYALPILLKAAAADPRAAYEYRRECGMHETEVLRVALGKMDLK